MIIKPNDLASHVHAYFQKGEQKDLTPSLAVFEDLFDILFYASLFTEEGETIQTTVAYYDVEAPRNKNKKFNPEKWSFIPFEDEKLLTVRELVKLSKAADPWSSTIAIKSNTADKLVISGLIDQAIHQQSYLNMEDDQRPDFPGLFHVSITGTGILTVFSDFELIATLKQDKLVHRYLNVFSQGPVADILLDISHRLNEKVRHEFDDIDVEEDDLDNNIASTKVIIRDTLARILNKIKTYNHGGALLITNDTDGLATKYKLHYDRLSSTIVNFKTNATKQSLKVPDDDESDPEEDFVYRRLKVRELLYTRELKGAIRFVASLSRVDGLVVMDENMNISGFGSVVTQVKYPRFIYVSTTLRATSTSLEARRPDQFGTRHRAMFAYCMAHPGSVGFVISQDGDVRAITKVGKRVVMWENIQLQKFSRRSSLP